MKSPLTAVLCTVGLLVSSLPATAQDFKSLTITSQSGNEVTFTSEALEAFDQVRIETSTLWTEGLIEFSGITLLGLLEEAGVTQGETVEMTALNDYTVSMPYDEIGQDYPIVALRMNGKPMSVRDKGPYWVVYPFDDDPDFRTEIHYSRSIWQLNRITVLE